MAYTRRQWVDYPSTETPIDADALNNIEDGIEESHNIQLLAVTDTAPSECAEGDKYFDTTTNLIYTATGTDEWGEIGETPIADILYIVLDEQSTYTYDGTDLVSVGGGTGGEVLPVGSEIDYDGSTVPTGWEQVEYPNIITAILTSNYTLTGTNVYGIIPLTLKTKIGDKLSMNSSGGIVIGAGVNYVKVSSNISFNSVAASGAKWNTIYRGTQALYPCPTVASDRISIANSGGLIPVTQGDVIYLEAQGATGDIIRGGAGNYYTCLTVEVVE